MNISQKPVLLPIALIADGEILKENLATIGHDEKWLMDQVKITI
ncbi:YetF domain-containing protein [Anaerosolibacter sp.]